jgi:glycosyltransferase involved in cell wall biosynthesis
LKDTSLVSVIIPTKNSGDTLEKCLKSIRGQTYSSIEIIVVDCFSGDKTRKIAEDYGATICESTAKRSQARNIGAQKAMGDLFFFVDSDMELLPSVVAECIKKIRERYDGVIVPEVSVGEGFWAECKALEKACYVGDDTIEAARLFTKNVFESICGYDSELEAGEDWDLSQRTTKAGYQIGRIGAFIMHNEGRLSLRETMLSKHYYGHAFEHYRVKHPQEAKYQLKLIRPAFIKNWKKLAKDPVHASGMLFMKACESAAVWFGMLTQETRI